MNIFSLVVPDNSIIDIISENFRFIYADFYCNLNEFIILLLELTGHFRSRSKLYS